MKSSRLLRIASGAAIVLGAVFAWRCSAGPKGKNLVIIALDTLRPDHLGCYGYSRATSPNIDAWAQDAVVFENAQSCAPWTAPSLLSLMTSLYPDVHGVTSFPDPGRMNDRVTTLAEVLKSHGYSTAAFTDGGYAKPQFGLKQGFDIYPLNRGDLLDEHASNLDHPDRIRGNVERTLEWLDEVEGEPFFLFFHTYQVHGPYAAPEECVKLFRPSWDEGVEHAQLEAAVTRWNELRELDQAGAMLINEHNEHCGFAQRFQLENDGLGARFQELAITGTDPRKLEFMRDHYDAEIRYTDHELQRVLDWLDRPGVRENTVVVFVSDHGEAFGEHGSIGHGNALHDEALRVLLMLRAPLVAPRRVKDVVRSIDVMPTVLELLDVPRDGLPMQGRSVADLLHGRLLASEPSFSHALSKHGREGRLRAVRDGRWRYVWDTEIGGGLLFDLEIDPAELADISSANADIVERMQGLLRAQSEIDASFRARASGPVAEYVIDDDTRRELEQLGYTEGKASSRRTKRE